MQKKKEKQQQQLKKWAHWNITDAEFKWLSQCGQSAVFTYRFGSVVSKSVCKLY